MMSISAVNNYWLALNSSSIYGTQATDSVSESDSVEASSSSSSVTGRDSFDLSKPAEIYSKLQELAQSDPEKLKEVCASIAEKLKSASESNDGRGSKMLSDLAEKFQNVAEGGDVSQLKPPEPPSFGGGSQGPIDKYAQQQDAQMSQLMNGNGSGHGRKAEMDQTLSSILDELNNALGN